MSSHRTEITLGNASKPETKITFKTETFTKNAGRELVNALRSNGTLENPIRKDYPDTPEGQQEKARDDAAIKAVRQKYWNKNQTEWSPETARAIKDILVKENQTVPARIYAAMIVKDGKGKEKPIEAATSKVYRTAFPLLDEQKKYNEATDYIEKEFPGGTFKKGKEGMQQVYEHVWNAHEQWAHSFKAKKKVKQEQLKLKQQKESNDKHDQKESSKAAPDAPGTVGSDPVPAQLERHARAGAAPMGGNEFGSPPSRSGIGFQNRGSPKVVSAGTDRTQDEDSFAAVRAADPYGSEDSNNSQKRTGAHDGGDPPAKRQQSYSDYVAVTQGEVHFGAFTEWCLDQDEVIDFSDAEFFKDPSFSNDTGPQEYVNWCHARVNHTVNKTVVHYLKELSKKQMAKRSKIMRHPAEDDLAE